MLSEFDITYNDINFIYLILKNIKEKQITKNEYEYIEIQKLLEITLKEWNRKWFLQDEYIRNL